MSRKEYTHLLKQVATKPSEGKVIAEGEWYRTAKQGAGLFMTKWIAPERARAALRHAVVSPNVTGRTKERIAQSKQARTGLLATID